MEKTALETTIQREMERGQELRAKIVALQAERQELLLEGSEFEGLQTIVIERGYQDGREPKSLYRPLNIGFPFQPQSAAVKIPETIQLPDDFRILVRMQAGEPGYPTVDIGELGTQRTLKFRDGQVRIPQKQSNEPVRHSIAFSDFQDGDTFILEDRELLDTCLRTGKWPRLLRDICDLGVLFNEDGLWKDRFPSDLRNEIDALVEAWCIQKRNTSHYVLFPLYLQELQRIQKGGTGLCYPQEYIYCFLFSEGAFAVLLKILAKVRRWKEPRPANNESLREQLGGALQKTANLLAKIDEEIAIAESALQQYEQQRAFSEPKGQYILGLIDQIRGLLATEEVASRSTYIERHPVDSSEIRVTSSDNFYRLIDSVGKMHAAIRKNEVRLFEIYARLIIRTLRTFESTICKDQVAVDTGWTWAESIAANTTSLAPSCS